MPLAQLLIAAVIAASPVALRESADVCILEINHVYYESGDAGLVQLLAWSWDRKEGRHVLRDWRLLKTPSDYPVQAGDRWEAPWGPNKRVSSAHLKESWYQADIEVLDQRRTPKSDRVPLFRDREPTPAIPPSIPAAIENWIGNDPLPPAP